MKSLTITLLFVGSQLFGQSFLTSQLKFSRVKTAYNEKDSLLKAMSLQKGLPYPPRALYFRAFKKEAAFEVWSQLRAKDSFILLATYPICASSGTAGPKVEAGDGQVPEGVYTIERFNPQSQFHLSLGVSYPNVVDRVRSGSRNTGGDIYVHGNCVTIGCIPLTDDKIKEVYLLAVRAKANGQQSIPIHIFPARLTSSTLQTYSKAIPEYSSLWTSLHQIYSRFETTRKKPAVQ